MLENRHIPRKRFGQHFLTDQRVLQRIADAVSPKPGQLLVEIGPGTGALTDVLLDRTPSLIAIELDRDLVTRLKQKYPDTILQVIQADALMFDFKSLWGGDRKAHKLRLAGNLPYNISTPLIFHLLQFTDIIQDMVFMVQKEVALRMTASPNGKHYGKLSVMTSLDLDCEQLFDVPPQAFHPPPKVDSTVVRLIPKSHSYPIGDRKDLKTVVSAAFSQRRKTIRNSLKKLLSEQQIFNLGIDPTLRAENLSVSQFIALSNSLQSSPRT